MRGHHRRSEILQPPRWRTALVLACLAAAVSARAQDVPAADPLVLTADRVRYWDESGVRWVLLEGRCAVLQGTEGVRSERAAVRIEPLGAGSDPGYRVEVHAEGRARFTHDVGGAAEHLRMTRATSAEVRIKSSGKGRPEPLQGPPAGEAMLARGFPDRARPRLAPSPRPATAGVVPGPQALAVAVAAPVDPSVSRAQFAQEGFSDPFGAPGADGDAMAPLEDLPPVGQAPGMNLDDDESVPGAGLEAESMPLAPPSELPPDPEAPVEGAGASPMLPTLRRFVSIYPKDSGGILTTDVKVAPDGRATIYLRGGVNVVTEMPGQGVVDATADNAVIWTRFPDGAAPGSGNVARLDLDPRQPLEIYLERNVVFRQDKRELAGPGDQKIVEADEFYMDFRNEWFVAQNARLNLFDARFITPIKIYGDEIQQHRSLIGRTDKGPIYGPTEIHADRTLLTGSRFPTPGYRFRSSSVDLFQVETDAVGPDGKPIGDPENPANPTAEVWRIDARQNAFFVGPVPVFWWPRILTETDDLDPPIRQVQFRANNYFGQQLLTDWSMYKILGLRKPNAIDNWNLDIDYLSYRGLALGSELGWSGSDLIDNILDPYNRVKTGRSVDRPYFGYFDIWGLQENRKVDTLGPGPAVVTNGPPGSGTRGFQRDNDPSFQDFRGRFLARHMQSFLPSDARFDEDIRLQLEFAYNSDRNFLEQYYKNLFDTGLDQKTLGYFIYQKENRAFTTTASANLQDWYTDSQWLPRVEYRRLGDSVLWDRLSWSQVWGADYANTHTDVMVNNPDIFAFQPFDPVSATSGAFRTGRIYTGQELDLPIDLGVVRFVPYLQGQAVGWDNQYATALPDQDLAPDLPTQAFIRGPQGAMLGRLWGAAGARANLMTWRNYTGVESELLNIHGLSHKVNFDLDYRAAYSSVPLDRIGLQDELDDNTYEFVRRYFALTNYRKGVLPPQYDPRFLTLRRAVSPITGTTDVQATMQTLQAGIHQRLQTKRGPEGRRRIVDYMILDLSTTYYPAADRDNFGKPFGQNMYNWEWYLGDRTSIISNGWFEFWDITGDPILASNPRGTNDPFGLQAITTGISINRPPRGNVFIGYSVVNTGPIATSAVNVSFSYWLSPKWYGSAGTSYDFGNAILLGSTFGVTRIGADFLTSVGLTVDPQRQSYMFGFELTPRLSPSIKFGSGGGIARFDSRYAPTQ